jgi:hypothetical protein
MRKVRFGDLDGDGDGSLDQKEAGIRLPTKDFKTADTDADGALSKNEYFRYADGLFRLADANKDDALDDKEFNSKVGKKLIQLLV